MEVSAWLFIKGIVLDIPDLQHTHSHSWVSCLGIPSSKYVPDGC